MSKIISKRCPECFTPFRGVPQKIYCCQACRDYSYYTRTGRRQRTVSPCAYCQALMTGPPRQRYCSPPCRNRARYERTHIGTEEQRQRWMERAPLRERLRKERAEIAKRARHL